MKAIIVILACLVLTACEESPPSYPIQQAQRMQAALQNQESILHNQVMILQNQANILRDLNEIKKKLGGPPDILLEREVLRQEALAESLVIMNKALGRVPQGGYL